MCICQLSHIASLGIQLALAVMQLPLQINRVEQVIIWYFRNVRDIFGSLWKTFDVFGNHPAIFGKTETVNLMHLI